MSKLSFYFLALVGLIVTSEVRAQNKRQLLLNGTSSCEKFPDFCPTECIAIDSTGCLVCQCVVVTNKTDSSDRNNTTSDGGATGLSQNDGSLTSSSSSNNMAGCPKLADNCNFDCLVIGKSGCIECTCTNGGFSMGLTGGATLTSSGFTSQIGQGSAGTVNGGTNHSSSVTDVQTPFSIHAGPGTSGTSAQASMNSNGCPAFSSNCDASCTTLDASGCPICKCTADSGPSNVMSPSLNSHQMSSGASANANGCPAFIPNCPQECVNLDGNGCPICICDGHSNGTSSSGTSSSSASNKNGCPSFPVNCRSDCVSLDSLGCPLCSCTTGSSFSTNTTSATSGSQTAGQASSNNNGCPAFPTNCRTDCVELSSLGCPVCTCTTSGSGTGTGSAFHNEYNHATSGSIKNNNGCPAFRSNCPAECTTTNDNGCPVCTCSGTSSVGQSSGFTGSTSATTSPSTSGGSNVECLPLMPHCNTACLSTDDYGCVLCNGDCNEKYQKQQTGSGSTSVNTLTNNSTSSTSGGSSGSGTGEAVVCSAFDKSCRPECASFDPHGCLVCTCTANTGGNGGTSGGNINGCESFDTNCPSGCAAVDKNGCLTCTCTTNGSGNSSQTGTGTGSSSGTSGGSGNAATVTCQAFDGAHCNPTCIGLDVNGCLSCDCGPDVTTPPSSSSGTQAPFVPGGGDVTTFAPGLVGTGNGTNGGSVSGSGGGGLTTFAPGQVGTGTGSGTQGGQTGAGNANACSPYDTNCPPGCTELDAQGCLSCTCSSQNGTNTGNGNGCPAFDTACAADCTHIDEIGCLTCACSDKEIKNIYMFWASHSTSIPQTLSPLSSGTTFTPFVPGSGTGTGTSGSGSVTGSTGNGNGCQPFDTNCLASCVSLDSFGCMACTCPGSASNSTHASGTSGTGTGCPPYDTTCSAACTSLDAMGCPKCTCTGGSTPAPGIGNQGGSGNANSCPPVDIMSCDPTCVQLSSQGCVICTCKAKTTAKTPIVTSTLPLTTTTQAKQTTTVKTHSCPKFDEHCPHNCIAIDTRGCLVCACAVTTQAPVTSPTQTMAPTTLPPATKPPTTQAPTTRVPTTRAPTTKPITTIYTTLPHIQTSKGGPATVKTTATSPGICPPIRCIYPCDAGVTLGADNCPVCKCRNDVTTVQPSV